MTPIGSERSSQSGTHGPIYRREAIATSRSACPHLYRARNLVERFFNKIKQCRRVATRYDKLAANYLAFVQLASIRVWLRANESAPWDGAETQMLFVFELFKGLSDMPYIVRKTRRDIVRSTTAMDWVKPARRMS
jgi:hypothetical protein